MENILLVCPVCRQRELEKLFAPLGATIFIAHGVCEARKNLCDMSFSLVVIESPLADGSARELAVQASADSCSDVVLLSPPVQVGHFVQTLGKYGIYTVSKNIGEEDLWFLINVLKTARGRLAALEKKNLKLMKRLSDERMLTKAKCVLAKEQGLTEEEAHRLIEKKAMDERISLLDAARYFINGF